MILKLIARLLLADVDGCAGRGWGSLPEVLCRCWLAVSYHADRGRSTRGH